MSEQILPESPEPRRHQPSFEAFGDDPVPPDGFARCTICRALLTVDELGAVCPGPPTETP
jgi:hypothetical protein